jgi:lysophospholipase L1-like esterase
MACRPPWRLANAGAAVVASLFLCEPQTRAQESVPVFESRPQVGALQCPSQTTTTRPRSSSPSDRIPNADDLEAGAVELPATRSIAAPKLPAELMRGFDLSIEHDEPLRVAFWGDSHVAAGYITDELVKYLEAGAYAVETRVIPASVGRAGVRLPLKKTCKGGEWRLQPSYSSPTTMQVGPSLANLRSGKVGDYLWLDFRYRPDQQVRRLQIHALPTAARTAIGVRIDDGPEVRIEVKSAVIELRATSSISTLKLRVLQGEFVLQHLTLDYARPSSITLDVFGLPSATVKGWANADVAYLKKSLAPDAYEAIVLEFGTNEGAVDRFNPAAYAAMLAASLRNVRQVLPHASCVLMGPTDRGMRLSGGRRNERIDLMYYARVHQQITRIQGEVGASFGCAVWDWQRFMGGPGSMYLWARDTPPLSAGDLIHLTPAGYRRTAAALADSLGWREP